MTEMVILTLSATALATWLLRLRRKSLAARDCAALRDCVFMSDGRVIAPDK
ncbi:hypothetical protein CLV44_104127 [Marinobacterium halophilum]|uniref:Uncharacterized protein n=1 Tax=Marinobacterium halophilum TaxID=267374 RepID=A0A2P8F1D8_9GAMM|nr:hypothetical protein CLV44_104127 [Marinobacterium halophilum]